MPVISVILAAYNAESTVKRMIDSIIGQTFTDLELIAIDDGSTDSTGKILDDYAAIDSRIKVVHKSNAGVAAARQDGINMAEGEYTIHADADDWIEQSMLEEMLHLAKKENADIVIADFFTDAKGKSTLTKQTLPSLKSHDILYGLYAKGLFGGLWHKLIKKSVYAKAKACFIPGINYCEDVLVLTQMLINSNPKISYLPKAYYHYVLDGTSLTRNVTPKGLLSLKRFHETATTLLPKDERFEIICKLFKKDEFIVLFMNNLYSDKKTLQKQYNGIRDILFSYSGLRWKLGYLCIGCGLIKLAHRLIRY